MPFTHCKHHSLRRHEQLHHLRGEGARRRGLGEGEGGVIMAERGVSMPCGGCTR